MIIIYFHAAFNATDPIITNFYEKYTELTRNYNTHTKLFQSFAKINNMEI